MPSTNSSGQYLVERLPGWIACANSDARTQYQDAPAFAFDLFDQNP